MKTDLDCVCVCVCIGRGVSLYYALSLSLDFVAVLDHRMQSIIAVLLHLYAFIQLLYMLQFLHLNARMFVANFET